MERTLILQRIEEIRHAENDFRANKWRNFTHYIPSDNKPNIDITLIRFNHCNDVELVTYFERIIKRYYAQT